MQDGQSDVFVMRLSTAIAIRTHCKNVTRRVDGWFPCIDVDTARKHGKEVVTTLVGPEAPVLKYMSFGGTGTCCHSQRIRHAKVVYRSLFIYAPELWSPLLVMQPTQCISFVASAP